MNTFGSKTNALRLYHPDTLMEFFTGIEYYMEIINEFFVGYALNIEKEVKECPIYRQKVKQKLNAYFNLVKRYDKHLAGETSVDYSFLVAEIHDRMDEYLQKDILLFENAVFLSVSRQGFIYPDVFSKLYVALTLTHYAKAVFDQYRGRLRSIDRRVGFYFRLFDPNACEGAIAEGYWHLCNAMKLNPSVHVVRDDSVNIGFKVIDRKLADVDTILEIIVQAKNYIEECSKEN